jgi:hypothetical protein
MSLWRADPSSRGILLTVMCVWVWSNEITKTLDTCCEQIGTRGTDCGTKQSIATLCKHQTANWLEGKKVLICMQFESRLGHTLPWWTFFVGFLSTSSQIQIRLVPVIRLWLLPFTLFPIINHLSFYNFTLWSKLVIRAITEQCVWGKSNFLTFLLLTAFAFRLHYKPLVSLVPPLYMWWSCTLRLCFFQVLVAGQGLNDNQWHTLRFSRRESNLKLQVDDDAPITGKDTQHLALTESMEIMKVNRFAGKRLCQDSYPVRCGVL